MTAVDLIEGSWDLVTCIEVVEHMSPVDADQAIVNMCAVTDRVLFSSGPGDFAEPTHVNVRPPADWAAAFALAGFFRRTDVDLSFLTPWAVLFERSDLDIRAVVHRYEAYTHPMRVEVLDKRAALLEAHRTISVLRDGEQSGDSADLKRRLLTLRDHAIGAESAAATARSEADAAKEEALQLLAELAAVKRSRTWRAGKVVLSPVRATRRILRGR